MINIIFIKIYIYHIINYEMRIPEFLQFFNVY